MAAGPHPARLATGKRKHRVVKLIRGMEWSGWAVVRTACGRTGSAYFPGADKLAPCLLCQRARPT